MKASSMLGVCPACDLSIDTRIHGRIDKSRASHTANMDSAFMRDEIEKKRSLLKMQKNIFALSFQPCEISFN